LMNELYRGRAIWNRSRWVRVPGTRRRRRVARPESDWIVRDRPDLRIIDDTLWNEVQARRARVREHYDASRHFGTSKSAYGKYLLSGLLACGTCGASMTIRTTAGSTQKYGCTRRWRRGVSACSNGLLIRLHPGCRVSVFVWASSLPEQERPSSDSAPDDGLC